MKELLEKLSKEKLIDFLMEYAANDGDFVNAVNVRFRKPKLEDELNKIANKIDYALDGVSDYRNHDSWGYVSFDVSDIISEIWERSQQGHIRLAFSEIELLYRKLIENFEYQGECEISDKAENCLDIMAEIADNAVLTEDKEYIFKKCIELSELDDGKDYGADYEDKLLRIAAKFVTPENLMELENALASFGSGWREGEFKLIRLEIIRIIYGEDAVDIFISENLRFPKIREIAFDRAMLRKNFSECERLCINALSENEQRYGISPWLYKLYSVYELTENVAKIMETSHEILLCGDLKYYDKLKSLLKQQGTWDNSYPDLLRECESKLHYTQYMKILAEEKEYFLLLEQTKKHTEQVYFYSKLLAEKCSAEVCEILTEQINKEAEAASGREAYSKVCSHIQWFGESGYITESVKMINDFKIKYKRKPAFVDELNKISVGVL